MDKIINWVMCHVNKHTWIIIPKKPSYIECAWCGIKKEEV